MSGLVYYRRDLSTNRGVLCLNPLYVGSRLLLLHKQIQPGFTVLIPFMSGLVYYRYGHQFTQKRYVLIPFMSGLVYYSYWVRSVAVDPS